MEKIILSEHQEDAIVEGLIKDGEVEVYTSDVNKMGVFKRIVYKSSGFGKGEKTFVKLTFKFAQYFKAQLKKLM